MRDCELKTADREPLLNAERASAAAGALHVRIIELESRAFQRLDVVNFDPFEIHGAHLVYRHLQTVKINHFVALVRLVLERHVILKARAAAANHRHAKRGRDGVLHAHDFFHFRACNRRQSNHGDPSPPPALTSAGTLLTKYSKTARLVQRACCQSETPPPAAPRKPPLFPY